METREGLRRSNGQRLVIKTVIAILYGGAAIVRAPIVGRATLRAVIVVPEKTRRLQSTVLRRHQPEGQKAHRNDLFAEAAHPDKRAPGRRKVNSASTGRRLHGRE
jgi:hypothetical protein